MATLSAPAAELPPSLPDSVACQAAIQQVERNTSLPAKLLTAIALVETGRIAPRGNAMVPWPWTINIGGTGSFFDTKASAIAAVRAAQAAGTQSIDVGCLQVNLMYHPDAFHSLDQAFDPAANTLYAADFLSRLHVQTGDWYKAAAAYHSQTPGISDAYAQRVMAMWPLASRYVGPGMAAPSVAPPPPSLFGLAGRGENELSRYAHNYSPELRARLAGDATERMARMRMGIAPESPASASRQVQGKTPGFRRETIASRLQYGEYRLAR